MKVTQALLSALFLMASSALGQTPKPWTFSFGGQLLDAGKPVAGSVAIELRFYKEATGGAPLPVTPVTFANVPLADGVFQVDATMLGAAELDLIFGGDKPTWVEVTANGKVYFRQMVVAVPYALRVPVDERRVGFDQTTGKLTVGPKTNASQGEFLTQDAAGQWSWQTPSVTSAAAATISGKSVDQAQPTAPGQVLKYDGASWKPESVLPAAAGDAGKFLKYNGASFVWDTPAGAGDMQKVSYDTNNDGIVNDADKLGGNPPAFYRDATNLNAGTIATARLPIATSGAAGAIRATAGKLSVDGTGAITSISADTAANFTGSLSGEVSGAQSSTTIAANAVTSSKISDGTVVDADISGSAGIGRSKLATTGDLVLSQSSGTAAKLKFEEPGGPDFVTIRAASGSAAYDLQLPTSAGGVGDVLKTDGSGALSWYPLANHTAQGATGAIQLKGATAFTSDANFVYASGKLGVGTNTPPFPFTVAQPAGASPGFNNGTTAFGIVHTSNTNLRLYMGVEDDGDAYLQADNVGNGFQPILISPYGGQVGIGTKNGVPSATLTVEGGAMPDNGASAKLEKLADWKLADSENDLEKGSEAQLWLGRWEDNGTNARSSMTFSLLHNNTTVTTDVLTMESSGKVGIGTTTPFDRLTVSGGSVLLENGSPSGGDGKFRTQTFTGNDSYAPTFHAHRAMAANGEVTSGVVLGEFAASGRQDGGSENTGGSIQVRTTQDWSVAGGRGSKVLIRAIKDGASTLTDSLAVYGGHVAFGGGQVHKMRVDSNTTVTALADDHVLILTAAGATVNLPSCGGGGGAGRVFVLRNTTGSSSSVATAGGTLSSGGTLASYSTRTVICDQASSTWFDL